MKNWISAQNIFLTYKLLRNIRKETVRIPEKKLNQILLLIRIIQFLAMIDEILIITILRILPFVLVSTPAYAFTVFGENLVGLVFFIIGPFIAMSLQAIGDEFYFNDQGPLRQLFWFFSKKYRRNSKIYSPLPIDLNYERIMLEALIYKKPILLLLRPFKDKTYKYSKVKYASEYSSSFNGSGNHWGLSTRSSSFSQIVSNNKYYTFWNHASEKYQILQIGLEQDTSNFEDLIEQENSIYNFSIPRNLIELGTSEENWFEVFKKCIYSCTIAIVIPDDTSGVLRELDFIISNDFIEKVLIYMPPFSKEFIDSHNTEIMRKWNKNRKKLLEKKSYNLPTYDKKGKFYFPNRDLSIRKEISTGNISRQDIEVLLSGYNKKYDGFSEIIIDTKDYLIFEDDYSFTKSVIDDYLFFSKSIEY